MATSIFLSHPLNPFSPLPKHHKIPTPKQTSPISSYHSIKHTLPNNPTTKTPFPPFPNSLFPFPFKPKKQFKPISVGRTQQMKKMKSWLVKIQLNLSYPNKRFHLGFILVVSWCCSLCS
ncbi:hypothetical protein RND71_027121 [Anisodus tanguticus]|uniref:Uncharacterized protein n=1 Tax=Anisodus tanguticus TaxID=243964 RepID=A0AAE1RPJ4_9SOLA|nr:hypothetical protein RND71_027121 [Anisodus tanguticus]